MHKETIYEQINKTRTITPRNNGEISNSITQNWTEQAVFCYKSRCNCLDCTIGKGNFSFVCQMPKVIKLLLLELGPPQENDVENKLLA